MKEHSIKSWLCSLAAIAVIGFVSTGCASNGEFGSSSSAAEKGYMEPGEYDEFYGFFSGGYNGQLGVYGLPNIVDGDSAVEEPASVQNERFLMNRTFMKQIK